MIPYDTGIPQQAITSNSDTARTLHQIHAIEGNEIQDFLCSFLNRANIPTGYYFASMGGITGTVADPLALILKAALLADCTSIVLSHSHPSGNLKPGRADEEMTQRIKQAAAYVDISVRPYNTCRGKTICFADDGII